ncbi:MAG TPA: hypothetical protein VNX88_11795 [Terriglobales bacterium]|nr:hypothetical protein [Terriglobales bacterium]
MLLIGILGGILVGLTGTSGAFLIPIMTLLFRETQVRAQGTALLIGALPIYLAPFIPYYRAHHYNLKLALLIAAGIYDRRLFRRNPGADSFGGLSEADLRAGASDDLAATDICSLVHIHGSRRQ